MVKPTINSEKHFRSITLTTVPENTVNNFLLIEAVAAPSQTFEVRIGSVIKAVHIELWYLSDASQPTFQISTVEKIQSNATAPSTAQMSTLHTYTNKRNILETTQGLVGDSNTNPMPVFRHWIKIPKGKQRFALGDKFYINVAARGETNNDIEVCGMVIFKEYY